MGSRVALTLLLLLVVLPALIPAPAPALYVAVPEYIEKAFKVRMTASDAKRTVSFTVPYSYSASVEVLPINFSLNITADERGLTVSGNASCRVELFQFFVKVSMAGRSIFIEHVCGVTKINVDYLYDPVYVVIRGYVYNLNTKAEEVTLQEAYEKKEYKSIDELLKLSESEDPVWGAIGRFFGWIAKGFTDAIMGFIEFAKNIAGFFINLFNTVMEFFKVLGSGLQFIVEAIGRPGDPGHYMDVTLRLAAYRSWVVDSSLREKVDSVLAGDCSVKLKEIAAVYPKLKNDERTICDIKPSGFLGTVSTFFASLHAAGGVVAFFFRHFLVIHALAFFGSLMFASTASLRELSKGNITAEPIVRWAEAWGKYINLYAKLIKWITDKITDLAEIIAELLPL